MKNLADNHWAKSCEGEGRIEWCCSSTPRLQCYSAAFMYSKSYGVYAENIFKMVEREKHLKKIKKELYLPPRPLQP
ncbi:hypothetical protein MDA_GLEAN10004415 [Myotis davidii]|uniref:Uncharacterized protein n=1 Tax=Myotis davidii TaxID=225400 RepID=L5M6G5_MYODS|nr:hypothetical protein MDA_GLEAN10004415 [Myotis davidii]